MIAFFKSNIGHVILTIVAGALVGAAQLPQLAPYKTAIEAFLGLLGVGGAAALPQLTSGK